jgi:toxin ParE1/3/4
MMPRHHVSPAADRDLDDQAAYLAREASLETALRFYDDAAATFERIARGPDIGERCDSANGRLAGMHVQRVDGFENHLVFYRPVGPDIEIVRVLHGARDLERTLGSGR